MKKIYILQMFSNTIPSKIVKTATRYMFTHVALSLNKDCNIIYSFGRKNINNIFSGGFTELKKNGKFYNKFSNTICRIFEYEVSDKQYDQLKYLINKIKDNEEIYKYDCIGIVLRYFKVPVSFKNKFVCSYFIAYLLRKAKIYNFNKKSKWITPSDFENIPGANIIYYGKYKEYIA